MPKSATADIERKQGRILRVKSGYNPNSSSVGSQIPYFFAFAMGSGAVSVLVMSILARFDRKVKTAADSTEPGENEDD